MTLTRSPSPFALDPERRKEDQGNRIVDVLVLLIVFSLGVLLPLPEQWWAKVLVIVLGIAVPLIALVAMGSIAFRGG